MRAGYPTAATSKRPTGVPAASDGHRDAVTVYLAWTAEPPADLDGPWREARRIAPGLLLLDSSEALSPVYHALKWSLPDGAALLVSPVHQTPKSRGMVTGTTAWLRRRTSPDHHL